MSQTLIHTSPNFGEISSNVYEDIVFTPFSGSLPPDVILIFDLLTPICNQHMPPVDVVSGFIVACNVRLTTH